jgi:hypothetical protein
MFDYKFNDSINSLYENIQKKTSGLSTEPSIEDVVKDIKNNPKKFIATILHEDTLTETLSTYLDKVKDDDADLGILALTLSQIINKNKK